MRKIEYNRAKHNNYVSLLLFISFAAVVLSISYYFENSFDLVKSAVFRITGTIFIIAASINYFVHVRKNKTVSIEFDKSIDPYILCFFTSITLSVIFSINPMVSFYGQYERQIGYITFIYLLAIYFISGKVFEDKEKIKTFIFIAELICVISTVYSVLQINGIDPFNHQPDALKRPVSNFGNAIFLGGFLALVFPFSLLNAAGKKNKFFRFLFPVAILTGVVISGTRSAYLTVICELVIISVYYLHVNKKNLKIGKYMIYASVILSAVMIIIILFLQDNFYIQRLISIFFSSGNPRLILWRDSINVFLKYPLTGTGVGMFPNAFEEFYSYELRFIESSRYFDHPHSNYFYVLCSTGIIGLVSYLALIIRNIITVYKNLKDKKQNLLESRIFASLLCFLAAYCVNGVTNFDDIPALFLLFVMFAILKNLNRYKQLIQVKTIPIKLLSSFYFILLIFWGYSAYYAFTELKADRYFKVGSDFAEINNFMPAVTNMSEAIKINERNSTYKFEMAAFIYRWVSENNHIDSSRKADLYSRVIKQLEIARHDFISKAECDEILVMVCFETGEIDKAELLKQEILNVDRVNINFRKRLVSYYFKNGKYNDAETNLLEILKMEPKNNFVLLIAAKLYAKLNNREKVKFYCDKVLLTDPQNPEALNLLKGNH